MKSVSTYCKAVFAGVVLTCLVSISVHAKTVKVTISGGSEKIEAFDRDGITYFSLSEFAEIVGGLLDWEMVGHRISYVLDTSRFDFVIGSPYFKLNEQAYNITFPVELRDGQLYLPTETFISYLDQVFPQKIIWDNDKTTIRVDSEYFNVTDLSISAKANGLLIEIFLTSALAYEVFVTEGNWVNVSIRDGKLNSARILSRRNRRYMYDLKAHQVDGAGQVSIRLKRKVENWHHKLQYDPPRIQISIVDEGFEIDTADTPAIIGPDDKIDVIVIDPGHGGKDSGAVGRGGKREKDAVLAISKRLAKLIRKDKQFKVIMTRDRDETVTLEQRAKIANEAGADLFISIHANSSVRRSVRGWNVFYLAPARNDSARAVAQFENSAFLRDKEASPSEDTNYEGDDLFADPVLSILNEMIMTEFQAESHDFAKMVDREFRRSLKTPARGVDMAGFFVLNSVFAPSVLIEAGFISNKSEEKLLKGKKYQQQVAEGIYRAIKRFKAKYEQ
ncbi:MAG: hypothetical protein DRP47_12440 [Candidatus Zixiibacteriota bacterium]|nr:MAG: hypothetical protein DRP47_12440 [candidate division Zixibacteria bacterium]